MTPPASVSGLYFWHPEARYFHIQRVNADQAGDYARRLGVSMEEAEKWLRPVLSYEPALAVRA
jgi:5-methyltetrahydrofolate--homocysteine methyltransferase